MKRVKERSEHPKKVTPAEETKSVEMVPRRASTRSDSPGAPKRMARPTPFRANTEPNEDNLVVAPRGEQTNSEPSSSRNSPAPAKGNMNILLVDDNKINLQVGLASWVR